MVGLTVKHESIPVLSQVQRGNVTVDEEPLDHLALPYEWTGSIDTANVFVGGRPTNRDHDPTPYDRGCAQPMVTRR